MRPEDLPLERRRLIQLIGTGAVMVSAGCAGDETDADDSPDDVGDDDGDEVQPGERVPPVELSTRSADVHPQSFEAARIFLPFWKELGLEIEHETYTHQAYLDKTYVEKDYDFQIGGWSGTVDRIDPAFHLYYQAHSNFIGDAFSNLANFDDPEYDELAEQILTTYEREDRQEVVYEAQEHLAEAQPITPLAVTPQHNPINTDTVEFVEPTIGGGITSYHTMQTVETTDGSFVYGGRGNINTTNPLNLAAQAHRELNILMHDRLYQIGTDGAPAPSLADGDPEVIDEQTFRVSLEDEEILFHDGEEVTAEDVAFSYEYQKEVGAVPTAGFLEAMESVEVVDDRTVEFSLQEPDASFLSTGLMFPFILPKHIWENIPEDVDVDDPLDWPNPDPVGCGPFQFDQWHREEEMRIAAFEDHINPPQVDSITKLMGPFPAMLDLLQQGDIDAVGTGASLTAIRELESAQDHVEVVEVDTHSVIMTFYNTSQPPFDNQVIRRAMAKATGKDTFNEIVFAEDSTPIHTPIAPANEYWHNPDVEEFGEPADLEAARTELEEAGFTWDDDGRLRYPE